MTTRFPGQEVMAPLIMDLLIMEVCLRGRVQHHHALKPGGMFGLYVQRKAPITHTHSEIWWPFRLRTFLQHGMGLISIFL